MAYYLTETDGTYALIDGDMAWLYPDTDVSALYQLSDDDYRQWCLYGADAVRFSDGVLRFERQPADKQALLAAAKADKTAALNAAAQSFIARLAGLDGIPDFEVQTWAVQAQEAHAWHADPQAVTPTLDTIAAARGVPPELLKQKAYEKAVKYEQATAYTVGLRQRYLDQIHAAKTVAALDKIALEFALPEAAGKDKS